MRAYLMMIDCVQSNWLHTLCKPFLILYLDNIFKSFSSMESKNLIFFSLSFKVKKKLSEEKPQNPIFPYLPKPAQEKCNNVHISAAILQTSFVKSQNSKDLKIWSNFTAKMASLVDTMCSASTRFWALHLAPVWTSATFTTPSSPGDIALCPYLEIAKMSFLLWNIRKGVSLNLKNIPTNKGVS